MRSGNALFPTGIAGGGLLLLRMAVGISFVLLSFLGRGAANAGEFPAILAAMSLLAGFQTRAVAVLSLAAVLTQGPWPLEALHVIDAAALALTGPGAWSADAILFGRRKVILPDREDTIV